MIKNEVIAGLDIGSCTVRCVIAESVSSQRLDIIGKGESPSRGMRKGVVVDMNETLKSVEAAVEEAERMSGLNISSVYVGVTGEHISSFNSHGVIAVANPGKEISGVEIKRVMDAARIVSVPSDREVIHVIPRGYRIDGQDGVKDPIGMSGMRLEVDTYLATGIATMLQNIVKCVQKAGLEVVPGGLVLGSLAASEAVLDAEEKELGAVLIDLGGGTTDVAVFKQGHVSHTAVIPVGGGHITHDIAVILKLPMAEAERIKIEYGFASPSVIKEDEARNIEDLSVKKTPPLSNRYLAEVIEARVQEILEFVKEELKKSDGGTYLAGAVLVGGGALLRGVDRVAEKVLDIPVRIGCPTEVEGLVDTVRSPAYSTAVGLVLYGLKARQRPPAGARGGKMEGPFAKVLHWLHDIF